MVTLPLILMIAALILLILAGLGVGGGRFNLGWLGLASWCLATLVAGSSFLGQ